MTKDEEIAALRAAIRKLVQRIYHVHHSDQWRHVWATFHMYQGQYFGPSYEKELEEARRVLEEE